jgi:hypothetical protein
MLSALFLFSLGLAICSQLVAQMGGRLKIHSRLGAGAEFSFSIAAPAVKELSRVGEEEGEEGTSRAGSRDSNEARKDRENHNGEFEDQHVDDKADYSELNVTFHESPPPSSSGNQDTTIDIHSAHNHQAKRAVEMMEMMSLPAASPALASPSVVVSHPPSHFPVAIHVPPLAETSSARPPLHSNPTPSGADPNMAISVTTSPASSPPSSALTSAKLSTRSNPSPVLAMSPSAGSPATSGRSGTKKLSGAAAKKEPPIPSLHVLIAEDTAVNVKVLTKLLTKDGHTVAVANNGLEAVEMYRAQPNAYNMILMDRQ